MRSEEQLWQTSIDWVASTFLRLQVWSLEVWAQRLAWSGSDKDSLIDIHSVLMWPFLRALKRESSSSFYEAINPLGLELHILSLFNYNYLLKALCLNLVTLGLGLQRCVWQRHTSNYSTQHHLCMFVWKAPPYLSIKISTRVELGNLSISGDCDEHWHLRITSRMIWYVVCYM